MLMACCRITDISKAAAKSLEAVSFVYLIVFTLCYFSLDKKLNIILHSETIILLYFFAPLKLNCLLLNEHAFSLVLLF